MRLFRRLDWLHLLMQRGQPLRVRIVEFFSPLTRIGWAAVAVAVVAAPFAFTVGWVEAGVVALMCVLSLLVALVVVLGRRPLKAKIHVPQNRTVAGQTVIGELKVQSARQRRCPSSVIELPVGTTSAQFFVPALSSDDSWSEVFAVPTRRRGIITLGPVRTVRADALGLMRRVRRLAEPDEVIVHPRTVHVPFDATGFQTDVEGVVTAKLSSSDVSFHALRDYVPGDDRRNVHWPTTARTGRLVVRQFEETRRSHHLLVLDTQSSKWNDEAFEIAVSVAASLGLAGVTASRTVSFMAGNQWVSTTSAMRMLDNLADIEMTPTTQSLSRRTREALASRPGVSVLTLVTSEKTSDEELSRVVNAASLDVACGVVRIAPHRRPQRSKLAGAPVIDCPSLDDLPRFLVGGKLR